MSAPKTTRELPDPPSRQAVTAGCRAADCRPKPPEPESADDKTARCLLVRGGSVLLVTHSNCSAPNRGKWALPGGRLEEGESPRGTLRRELREELELDVETLYEVGRYISRERWHRIYWAECAEGPERWDAAEIEEARWFSPEDVVALEGEGQLHYGFEAAVVADWLDSVRDSGTSRSTVGSSVTAGPTGR